MMADCAQELLSFESRFYRLVLVSSLSLQIFRPCLFQGEGIVLLLKTLCQPNAQQLGMLATGAAMKSLHSATYLTVRVGLTLLL